MRLLVTGAAGFIGSALSQKLLEQGHEIIGLDNFSPYYDVQLKKNRIKALLSGYTKFKLIELDIADRDATSHFFQEYKPQRVVHLAAQAGVRYSLENPHAYIDSNILGFLNILGGCRHNPVEHLVYASSSSVYGGNKKIPFSVTDSVDHPLSLYAASKKANELMAHSYSSLYGIPMTGLRFFTVYGPWGRPDMSVCIFTRSILEDKPIPLFNGGKHKRDLTYIDDIVEGVARVLQKPATPNPNWKENDPSSSQAPHRLYNIGNNNPVWLEEMISSLENALGKKAKFNKLPMQPGDVEETYADIDALQKDFDFRPRTSIREGIKKFVDWYKSYYELKDSGKGVEGRCS